MGHLTSTHISRLKQLCISLLVGTLMSLSAQAGDLQLKEHTIQWTGSMPAKTHTGLLTPTEADLTIDDEGNMQSLHVVLDMNSIDVTDLEAGKMRNKLIKHLRSDDFFAVETYPTAAVDLNKVENGILHGTITIRGIEKPIEIPAQIERTETDGWQLSGAFEFIRQDFGVKYQNKGLFSTAKEKLIKDEVTVEVALVFEAEA